MAKIYIRFELIGSGNLDYRNIVSAGVCTMVLPITSEQG